MPYPYVSQPNYVPNYYQPVQPIAPAAQSGNNNNGLIWVQGEAGAKSFLVSPGTTVLLMDSESQKFYLKTADNSGMPMPLRIFEYKEVTAGAVEQIDTSKYVTREELDKIIASLKEEKNG